MSRFTNMCCVWLGLLAPHFAHAQLLRLPDVACADAAASGDGFEGAPDSWPSRGVGGAVGSGNAFVAVPDYESNAQYNQREYFYFVPESSSTRALALPLVVALHGTAGSRVNARNEARIVRDIWIDAATRYRFAVLVPVAGSSQGSWIAPDTAGEAPTDYDVIATAISDLEARHDIERLRRYLWGYSAGGHVALDVMLNQRHERFDRRQFAAVGTNAGALAGLACAGIGRDACDLALGNAFPRLPLQSIVGDVDPLVAHTVDDAARFRVGGWTDTRTFRLQTFAGGHRVELEHPQQHWLWMCQFSRRIDPIQRFRLRPSTL